MNGTTVACPACGGQNPSEKRFCGDCGAPLSAAAIATPEKERRLVTILFADLVGSTALGETLDPEAVDELVGSAQAVMAQAVALYGGQVAKYLGDGLMALFGAPVAHEDDAERAILAGLRMHEALENAQTGRPSENPVLKLRVGITSGEVIAAGRDGSYDVIGDAANTAARLQGAADVGEVLVGAETMQLARRRIRFGSRRELSLKGKARAVAAYSVLGLRERVAERWEMPLGSTPLVGRDRELSLLLDAWQRAQAGEGRLITLAGEAGVGKSRLVNELVERALGDAADISVGRVLRGRCLSYGQEIGLWLVADLLRSLCGIAERHSLDERRARVAETIGFLLTGEEGRERAAEAIDVVGEVLGLAPDGSGAPNGYSTIAGADAQFRRQALIRSLLALLAAVSSRSATILVLEDLHWIDVASAEVLAEVMADVSGLRLLVVAAQRPDWTAPWSGWRWPARLTLRPMDEPDTAALASAVLEGVQPGGSGKHPRKKGAAELSPALERYVRERTGGNPYFVEELLRTLQETNGLVEEDGQMRLVTGVADHVPASLTEMLLARLDRLEAQARGLAQVASVIGRNFAVRLLAQVVSQEATALEGPLAALRRADVALPRRGSDMEYIFKHATIREVAYNTLLQRRRQEIHATTARAIADLYPTGEYVQMIAYHFSRSAEHAQAATWLERAGDRAAEVYANETAISQYEEARRRLEYLQEAPLLRGAEQGARARVDEKLGGVLRVVGRYDEALRALERVAHAYRELGEVGGEARVLAQIGQTHYHRGTTEEGIARLELFLESADRPEGSVPAHPLAGLYVALTLLYFAGGSYRPALEAAGRASGLAKASGDDRVRAQAEVSRGLALAALGRRDVAQRVLEGAIPLAEAAGDLDSQARALDNLASVHYFRGEFERSRQYFERGLAVAERMSDPALIVHMLFMLGTGAWWGGDWTTARAYHERARSAGQGMGESRISALPLYGLGELAVHEGEWEKATEYLEQAIRLFERSGNLPMLKWSHQRLADKELRQGRPEAALARMARLLQRRGLEQSTALLAPLAQAHLELGNEAEAEEEVAQAVARATAEDDAIELSEALRVSAMLAIRQERWDDAAHILGDGLTLARRMSCPYVEARFLYLEATLHRERGGVGRARQRLEEAETIFHRLGARWDAERTERAVAELG